MQYNQTQFQPQAQWAPARWVRVGVGWRFLALLIDGLIIGLIASIISITFFPYGLLATDAGRLYLDTWPVVGLGGSTGLVGLAYYILLEGTRGATFGKMALRMRVVKVDGSPIGWSEAIIRNLLRIVDAFFGYLVGAILIWSSPLKQRLGDRVANTVVIRYEG